MPDFIVIGAMKSATSTICAYLEDHPDVYMVPRCDPNYFSHDENFAKGPGWYESHFSGRTSEKLCGEGSNDYASRALYPDSAERMHDYDPGLKIIYMVRHPVDRIVSAWIQNRTDSGDMVPPTLDRAVREMPDLFVGQSRYWYNIAPYRALFGDDRIFVGFMEDLNDDPERFFEGLCGFLGIPKTAPKRERVNESRGKRVPTPTYSRINGLPFMQGVKAVLPTGLKRTVKDRLLSHRVSGKPSLSPDSRREIFGVLREDSREFLRYYGKPSDFWDLSDPE